MKLSLYQGLEVYFLLKNFKLNADSATVVNNLIQQYHIYPLAKFLLRTFYTTIEQNKNKMLINYSSLSLSPSLSSAYLCLYVPLCVCGGYICLSSHVGFMLWVSHAYSCSNETSFVKTWRVSEIFVEGEVNLMKGSEFSNRIAHSFFFLVSGMWPFTERRNAVMSRLKYAKSLFILSC